MLAFGRKPGPSVARPSSQTPASQRPAQNSPVSPLWLRLPAANLAGAAASSELTEGRRRYFATPPLQRKPALSTPGDAGEREADAVADAVMGGGSVPSIHALGAP